MKLTTIIYTTNKSLWIKRDFADIIKILLCAPGVIVEPFTVKYFPLPAEVPTYKKGGTYIDWKWLKANCPALGHNAVCLHISERERTRLGLKHPDQDVELGGVYNKDSDNVFDFVVIADEYSRSYGGMTAFVRIFVHELSHGFSHFRGVTDFTHIYDYKLKNIKSIFYTHSFSIWNKLAAQVESLKLQILSLTKGFDMKNQPNKHDTLETVSVLYQEAIKAIGMDASPEDLAPDELGCAETVSSIVRKVLPDFPVITGTWVLNDKLSKDERFERVGEPEIGAIIMSPTGMGNGTFPGHTGICGDKNTIMSNVSATGKFDQNYTIESWKLRYMVKGQFPMIYYRLKK